MKNLLFIAILSFSSPIFAQNKICYIDLLEEVGTRKVTIELSQLSGSYTVKLSEPIETSYGSLAAGDHQSLEFYSEHIENSYYEKEVTQSFEKSSEGVFGAWLRLDATSDREPVAISVLVEEEGFYGPTIVWHYPLHCSVD